MVAARHHPDGARALRRRGLIVATLVGALLAAAPAGAQAASPTPVRPGAQPPPGRESTVHEVLRAARAAPRMRRLLAAHPGATARAYLRDRGRWQVSFSKRGEEIGQAILADHGPRVLEAWTGVQVAWTMARGRPGAFGGHASALYVWLPLLALFVLPFLRPPWRLLHLDLAAIGSLSVSVALFNRADVDASVPLAYPPLVYLLVRLLALARPGRRASDPLRLLVSPAFLGVAAVFLLGFRLGMQITDSNVIDVGYAGVVGADRIAHGEPLYGHFPADNPHGDTYGPLNYLAYVPFELLWPWEGEWDDLPAAHAATAAFDLGIVTLLWLVGRRLGGNPLAALLPYLWLACPFTLLAANSGANDGLVGLLVLGAFALAGRPVARGAAVAAAALAKFAPLALVPLLVGRSRAAAAGLALTLAAGLGLVAALDGGLGEAWERTVGFQADRDSPFSVWGLWDLPAGLQLAAQAGAAVLAVAAAFVRRDEVGLAALAAAVLIAVQLGVTHWFYLYVVWFLPLVLVAVAGDALTRGTAAAPARSSPPVAVASSG